MELEEVIASITQEVLETYGYDGPPVSDMSEVELKALYELTSPDVIAEIDRRIAEETGVQSIEDLEVHGEALIPPIGRIFVGAARAAPTVVGGLGRGAASLATGLARRIGLLSDDALRATGVGGIGRGSYTAATGGRLGAAGAAGQATLPGMAAATAGRTTASSAAAATSQSWLRSTLSGLPKPKTLTAIQNLSPNARRLLVGGVGATALGTYLAGASWMPHVGDDPDMVESGEVTLDSEGNVVTEPTGRGSADAPPSGAEEVLSSQPAGTQMYNSMYWEGHSVESANDKFMNFITGKHIPVGVAHGSPTFAEGAGMMGMRVENIRSGPERANFENHILTNWETFPRFKLAVLGKLSQRLTDFQEANHWRTVNTEGFGAGPGAMTGMIRQQSMLEGPVAMGEPLSAEHRSIIEAMLAGGAADFPFGQGQTGPTHGAYTTVLEQFKALDEEFGDGSADQALSGVIDEAMQEYVDKYTRTNPSMIMYSDTSGDTGYLTEFDLTEDSYDGTPGGSVFSLMDLFSGPLGLKVGPAYNRPYLDDKFAQTQVNGASSVIAEYQQAIYAMGYFRDPRDGKEYLPATWGVVDDLTVNALSRLQWDIAGNMARAEDLGLNPDVNKVYMQMQNQSISEIMANTEQVPSPEAMYRAKVINDVKTGIDNALFNRGVSIREGSDIYANTVKTVLDSLTPGERETAWGQGGSPEDRAGALHILDNLTGGNYTEFGAMGRDQEFVNYAHRVGALSEDEMTNLSGFNTPPGQLDQLKTERGKDVAVSNFLLFLDKPVHQASREEIRNAAIMYANTVGMGTVGKAGLTVDMIRQRTDHAYDSLQPVQGDPASIDLFNSMEDRVSNAMGVDQQGIGGGRYSNLLDVLNQSYSTQRAMRV